MAQSFITRPGLVWPSGVNLCGFGGTRVIQSSQAHEYVNILSLEEAVRLYWNCLSIQISVSGSAFADFEGFHSLEEYTGPASLSVGLSAQAEHPEAGSDLAEGICRQSVVFGGSDGNNNNKILGTYEEGGDIFIVDALIARASISAFFNGSSPNHIVTNTGTFLGYECPIIVFGRVDANVIFDQAPIYIASKTIELSTSRVPSAGSVSTRSVSIAGVSLTAWEQEFGSGDPEDAEVSVSADFSLSGSSVIYA